MVTQTIETMEKWLLLKAALIKQGYVRFTSQYWHDQPEGYHACFLSGDKMVEVVTHKKKIQLDIQNM